MLAQGAEVPLTMRQPLFRHMHQIDASRAGSSDAASEQALDTKLMFTEAGSLAEAAAVVAKALKAKLSKIMGMPQDDIDLQHGVESYGVDSLVAVELLNWLAKELRAEVAVFEILGGATGRWPNSSEQEFIPQAFMGWEIRWIHWRILDSVQVLEQKCPMLEVCRKG